MRIRNLSQKSTYGYVIKKKLLKVNNFDIILSKFDMFKNILYFFFEVYQDKVKM